LYTIFPHSSRVQEPHFALSHAHIFVTLPHSLPHKLVTFINLEASSHCFLPQNSFSRFRLPTPSRSHFLAVPSTVSSPTCTSRRTNPPIPSSQKSKSNQNTQRNTSLTYPQISPSLLIALSTLVVLSTVEALSTSILELPSLGPNSCISRPSCSCSCSRLISTMRPCSRFQDHKATRSPAARKS
jgi:hypothetical protein